MTRRLIIATTAHHPDDGRLSRHKSVLGQSGWEVTIVALSPRSRIHRTLGSIPLLLKAIRDRPDAILFPDPELFTLGPLIARAVGIRSLIDVHEDYRSVALRRDWIPELMRKPLRALIKLNESAGRRLASATLVAADHLKSHGDVVVSNLPPLGTIMKSEFPQGLRAVYIGDISTDRGAGEMIELLRLVASLELDLIGPIAPQLMEELTEQTGRAGTTTRLTIHGRLPYLTAWERATGAAVGFSLLRPTPAYREAVPSKLWEYFASGIPVIATDLPAQAHVVTESGGGWLVGSVDDAAEVLNSIKKDPEQLAIRGSAGYRYYLDKATSDRSAERLLMAVSGG